MQTVNVLIVGNGANVALFKQSKFLNKLYVTSENEIKGTLRIMFNTFAELAEKCKALQIDLVIVEEEKWVLQGISDVLRKNHINCFSASSKWTNLKLFPDFAYKILNKYEILTPPIIKLPVEYPVILKTRGIIKKANSMQDVINIKSEIYNTSPDLAQNIFLEKYLHGEKHKVISLFDKKTLVTFPQKFFPEKSVNEYTEKLKKMLINENADFVGFINSELLEENGMLYNTGFSFEFIPPDIDKDIIFILLSAVYQKLNEIS